MTLKQNIFYDFDDLHDFVEEKLTEYDETGPLDPESTIKLGIWAALTSLKYTVGGQVFSEKEKAFRSLHGKLLDRIEGFSVRDKPE